ncbi:MAG: HAD hydrolase-like protein [Clostridia bacterium]|nr:HAD hydrolase-like protein [Clostridia bacterium]
MRKTVVLFDLWETLFTNDYYSFEDGLQYLYDGFFSERCTYEEWKAEFYAIFHSLFRMIESGPTEVCLIKEVIPPLFAKFGVAMPQDDAELEYAILTNMQKYSVEQNVRDVLERLSVSGVKIDILSNGLFRGSLVERLLEESGIRRYFERVFSSADYGVKKPGKGFFDVALKQIRADHPGIRNDQILYVGNDYEDDVCGGTGAGLETVWLNVLHHENADGIPCHEIDDITKVLEYV